MNKKMMKCKMKEIFNKKNNKINNYRIINSFKIIKMFKNKYNGR